jgi:hypothetical protein
MQNVTTSCVYMAECTQCSQNCFAAPTVIPTLKTKFDSATSGAKIVTMACGILQGMASVMSSDMVRSHNDAALVWVCIFLSASSVVACCLSDSTQCHRWCKGSQHSAMHARLTRLAHLMTPTSTSPSEHCPNMSALDGLLAAHAGNDRLSNGGCPGHCTAGSGCGQPLDHNAHP